MTSKYKKGDLVIVNEAGKPTEFEIISSLISEKGLRKVTGERYYEAKEVSSSKVQTISEDEILRLATPVDNSAQLFSKKPPSRT